MGDVKKTKKQLINELKELRKSNCELENVAMECRRTLEDRVKAEVARKREIDHILIEQSRQAAMGDMIGHIAHQWRQPLTVISLLVQDISECYQYGNFTKEYLDITIGKIVRLIQNMSMTVDNYRDFFMPDKVGTHFFIDEIVDKTLSFMEASLKYYNIAVEVDLEAGLSVRGQPNEYSQVLLNIINNTKDAFIENKTESPRISIKGYREHDRTVVTISHNAGDIPDAVIERIFSPEFGAGDLMDGKDLWLYTSRIIVKNNFMGNLSARNAEHGAEFRIEV